VDLGAINYSLPMTILHRESNSTWMYIQSGPNNWPQHIFFNVKYKNDVPSIVGMFGVFEG